MMSFALGAKDLRANVPSLSLFSLIKLLLRTCVPYVITKYRRGHLALELVESKNKHIKPLKFEFLVDLYLTNIALLRLALWKRP